MVARFVYLAVLGFLLSGCASAPPAPRTTLFTSDAARAYVAKEVGAQTPSRVTLERQYDSYYEIESIDGLKYTCNGSTTWSSQQTLEFVPVEGNLVRIKHWVANACGAFFEFSKEARFTDTVVYLYGLPKEGESGATKLTEIETYAIEAGGRVLRPLETYDLVDGTVRRRPIRKVGETTYSNQTNRITQLTGLIAQPYRADRASELRAIAAAQQVVASAGKAEEDARREEERREREEERKEHAARVYQGIMTISGGVADGLRSREANRQRNAEYSRSLRSSSSASSTITTQRASVARQQTETLERLRQQREIALATSAPAPFVARTPAPAAPDSTNASRSPVVRTSAVKPASNLRPFPEAITVCTKPSGANSAFTCRTPLTTLYGSLKDVTGSKTPEEVVSRSDSCSDARRLPSTTHLVWGCGFGATGNGDSLDRSAGVDVKGRQTYYCTPKQSPCRNTQP